MGSANTNRGVRLLAALRSQGCPGVSNWTGGDLDWLWDDEGTTELLDWVCQGGGGAEALTEEELRRWEELKETEPLGILEGQLLEEALKVEIRQQFRTAAAPKCSFT
jgi:hypothetical protein